MVVDASESMLVDWVNWANPLLRIEKRKVSVELMDSISAAALVPANHPSMAMNRRLLELVHWFVAFGEQLSLKALDVIACSKLWTGRCVVFTQDLPKLVGSEWAAVALGMILKSPLLALDGTPMGKIRSGAFAEVNRPSSHSSATVGSLGTGGLAAGPDGREGQNNDKGMNVMGHGPIGPY